MEPYAPSLRWTAVTNRFEQQMAAAYLWKYLTWFDHGVIFSTAWRLSPSAHLQALQISWKMPHTWMKTLHHFISSCSVHPDLMGSGRMEPQLKPLIVPRPPAHHCGKWRSMRGKIISCSPGPCSLFLTTENVRKSEETLHWGQSV